MDFPTAFILSISTPSKFPLVYISACVCLDLGLCRARFAPDGATTEETIVIVVYQRFHFCAGAKTKRCPACEIFRFSAKCEGKEGSIGRLKFDCELYFIC
jgi:hypothetical protein